MSKIKTERNLEIVRQLFNGVPEREIARIYNIRPSRVHKIKEEIIERVTNNFSVSIKSLPKQVGAIVPVDNSDKP